MRELLTSVLRRSHMPSHASVPTLPQLSLDSSSLLSVGYSGESGIMEIAFHNGSIYRYFAVPPEVHQALLAASSKGRYFNAAIRSCFRFERLRTLPRQGAASNPKPSSPPPGKAVADISRPEDASRCQAAATGQLTAVAPPGATATVG